MHPSPAATSARPAKPPFARARSTVTLSVLKFAVAMSANPSPVKSAATRSRGDCPTGKPSGSPYVAHPDPIVLSSTVTLDDAWLHVTRSGAPSRFRSTAAIDDGVFAFSRYNPLHPRRSP